MAKNSFLAEITFKPIIIFQLRRQVKLEYNNTVTLEIFSWEKY